MFDSPFDRARRRRRRQAGVALGAAAGLIALLAAGVLAYLFLLPVNFGRAGAGPPPDRSHWMQDNPALAALPLYRITLPGTHDSATYDLTTRRVPPQWRDVKQDVPGAIVRRFAQTQSQSLLGQLRGGIRYFDLRPYCEATRAGGWNRRTIYAYHDAIGPTFDRQLREVRSFLDSECRELVILKISHFAAFDPAAHADLTALIQANLGPYLYRQPAGAPALIATPLGQFVAKGPCVLVLYDDPYATQHPAPGVFPWAALPIYDSYANSSDFPTMRADQLSKLRQHAGGPNGLFLLSWTLTITDADSISKANGRRHDSLYDLTRDANPGLAGFVNAEAGKNQINILYVDFFEESGAVDLAIALNRGGRSA